MNAVTPTGAAKQPPYDFKAYEEMDTGSFPDDEDLISQPGKPEAVSAMLDQFLIQAEGRGKAMDKDYIDLKSKFIGCQDKVDSVVDKLELMHNLFSFYSVILHLSLIPIIKHGSGITEGASGNI
jgi:hypothetical protein